jgi:hypothetical protein
VLEDERFKSQQYTFNVKVRFMELRDEEAHDLLHPQGGHGFNKNALKYHEWEGAYIQGINWVPVFSKDQAAEFFKGGLANRTKKRNEFGAMADKSAQIF